MRKTIAKSILLATASLSFAVSPLGEGSYRAFAENEFRTEIDAENFYHDRLTDTQKELYADILEAAENDETEMETDAESADDVYDAFSAVVGDHPELGNLEGIRFDTGNGILCFENYGYDENNFEENIDGIANHAKIWESDRMKAVYFLWYIGKTGIYNDTVFFYPTAYDYLDDRSGVCTAFAKTFVLCCREAGIPCIYVTGTVQTGDGTGGHAWCLVRYDGSWHTVDPTACVAKGGDWLFAFLSDTYTYSGYEEDPNYDWPHFDD